MRTQSWFLLCVAALCGWTCADAADKTGRGESDTLTVAPDHRTAPDTTGHRTLTGHQPDTGPDFAPTGRSFAGVDHRTPDTPYDFSSPDTTFELENDLYEISGLTVLDDRRLAAVEDEHGRFYVLDLTTGKILDERRFAGKGDYEDIELADGRLFVLRSDGQLREVLDFDSDDPDDVDDDKHNLPLHAGCDAEGLAYQKSQNRLLVSCKEHPGRGLRGMRAVYAVDLNSLEMNEAPVYLIRTDTVRAALGATGSFLSELLSPIADLDAFKPSALAVHPLTGEHFVLSSVLKVIVVLDAAGSVSRILPLSHELVRQPEALAFLPNGDLFLASEGAGGKARLYRFNRQPS